MESLKATFPDKSGEVQAWNFGKFHDILHLQLNIILWGWIEITSGQPGEGEHRELLNALAGSLAWMCQQQGGVYAVSWVLGETGAIGQGTA